MSKRCARCEKTVYPTEELKCLDKVVDQSTDSTSSHKHEFICGYMMELIRETNSLVTENFVVITAEEGKCVDSWKDDGFLCLRKYTEQQKVGAETSSYQMQVWHKICFKCKECGMSLNMRNYKGFNKEPYCEAHIPKAKATPMAETPELKRIAENTKLQSNVKYHADFEKSKGKCTQVADDPETLRIKQNTQIISNVAYHGELQRKAEMEQRRTINENGYRENDQKNANITLPANVPVQQQQPQQVPLQQQQQQQQQHQQQQQQQQQQPTHPQSQHIMSVGNPNNIGKISDYDPLAGSAASPYSGRNSQNVIYTSEHGALSAPQRQIGSVHDMDPVNHNYGSLGRVYRAMYDYEALDDDEVSFMDGDLIINVSSVEGGWMTGEVQRTGQVGMLPANYVQLANI